MAILITGGTGFIGSQIARILRGRGEERLVLFDANPSTQRLDDLAGEVEVVRGDLGNFGHVLDVVRRTRPRVIYHLGAMLSVPSEADPAGSIQANVLGTSHVLEAARLFDVPRVLFTSSIVTYGSDIRDDVLDDYTLQRPQFLYGIGKLFGEHLGLFYRRKYGLDFRAVRYPSIMGPGVRSAGIVQYTSWMIEESAKGNPYTVNVTPDTRCPVLYFKDAARAIVLLGDAPDDAITRVNYLVAGPTPIASAEELATMVRARVPGARIDFQPDLELQRLVDRLLLPLDDRSARQEWGWQPEYDQERIVDDFLDELRRHPHRYA
jgi:threonine 3-dehydrogenase